MKQKLKGVMEQSFRPEFLNRVDDIIVFRSLTKDNLKHIIDIELSKVIKRLKEKNLSCDDRRGQGVPDREGHQPDYGARPLRRAIEQHLEDPLAEDLLRGTFAGKDTIIVKTAGEKDDKKLIFEATTTTAPELVEAGSSTAITTG